MKQTLQGVADTAAPIGSVGSVALMLGGVAKFLADAAPEGISANGGALMFASIISSLGTVIVWILNARRNAAREDRQAALEALQLQKESERIERGDGDYKALYDQRGALIAQLAVESAKKDADIAKLQADVARLTAQLAGFQGQQQGAK